MLRNLAAQEDLLFLLAESQGPEPAHAVFAHHAGGPGRFAVLMSLPAPVDIWLRKISSATRPP